MRYIWAVTVVLFPFFAYASHCQVPSSIRPLVTSDTFTTLKNYPDIRRNLHQLKHLCVHKINFVEGKQHWEMLLVTHPKHAKGFFWFLPHDNENTAFDSAIYAVRQYGGGFLSVLSGGKRYHQGQDPNRNFSESLYKEPSCRFQKAPSPYYTQTIFKIIDVYKGRSAPYLSIHNNTNAGGISVLRSSSNVRSYPAYPLEKIKRGKGLADEDNLVYIAGRHSVPSRKKLNKLLQNGLNVKYEMVRSSNNDCSMSKYIVLGKHTDRYYNIEAQHGDVATQRRMIDLLVRRIMR